MMKIFLTVLILIDFTVLLLFILGVVASINAGGGNVLFPGLGLVVSLPLVMGVVLVFEMILIGVTLSVYRLAGNNANDLK